MKLAFVLPARAGGGGVHSVVQEASELSNLGCDVRVLVPRKHVASFRTSYTLSLVQQVGVTGYETKRELRSALEDRQVAIATVFTSARTIRDAIADLPRGGRPKRAYYIQDYEPFFCEPNSQQWDEARASYELGHDLMFAKTRWLCEQVAHRHRCSVAKVEPSVDHAIYRPRLDGDRSTLVFCAMIRPATPRRAPERTCRLLNWLAATSDGDVEIHAFGAAAESLEEHRLFLDSRVRVHGVLRREEVAELLRCSDFFLDLSDYQAFGRTGMEAMACGCIPVMPSLGGAAEFVADSVNGFLADTRSDEVIMAALETAKALSDEERGEMALAALATASSYSIRRSAISELRVLSAMLSESA